MQNHHDVTDSLGAVIAAATSVGLDAEPAQGQIVISVPGGASVIMRVSYTSLITEDSASRQLARWSHEANSGTPLIAIADRITATARSELTRAGSSWLDLRGHLRLAVPGLFVDSDVPPMSKSAPDRAGFTGQVSVEVAVLLLSRPDRAKGVRAAASSLSRAPSSVSAALGALRGAGLVNIENEPELPELFWELANQWSPVGHDIATWPHADGSRESTALRLGLGDVSAPGWALTDTVAAAVYGAPVAMQADHPRDFYVPDHTSARRARQLLGVPTRTQDRAGRVLVAPVAAVCSRRVDAAPWSDEPWPLAQPLFVALDLAQDPGRGREILDGWTPRKPWRRVW